MSAAIAAAGTARVAIGLTVVLCELSPRRFESWFVILPPSGPLSENTPAAKAAWYHELCLSWQGAIVIQATRHVFIDRGRHSDQPSRYSRRSNLFAASSLVTRIPGPSQSSFFCERTATLPSMHTSESKPE